MPGPLIALSAVLLLANPAPASTAMSPDTTTVACRDIDSPEARLAHFRQRRVQLSRQAFAAQQPYPTGRIADVFNACFGDSLEPSQLQHMDDAHLQSLYKALLTMATSRRAHVYIPSLIRVARALLDRDLTQSVGSRRNTSVAQKTHDLLINFRWLQAAEQLRKDWPEAIEASPFRPIHGIETVLNQAAILVPDPAGKGLQARAVPIREGRWFVGVVHTGCAFSRRAMTYLETHADTFRALLPDNSIWVTGQDLTQIIPDLEEWNADAELVDIHVSYDDRQWPGDIQLTTTPMFYVLEDGQVVDQVSGWVDDAQAAKLKAMLQEFRQTAPTQATPPSRQAHEAP